MNWYEKRTKIDFSSSSDYVKETMENFATDKITELGTVRRTTLLRAHQLSMQDEVINPLETETDAVDYFQISSTESSFEEGDYGHVFELDN